MEPTLDQGFLHPSRYRLDFRGESLGLQCDRAVTKKRICRITLWGQGRTLGRKHLEDTAAPEFQAP